MDQSPVKRSKPDPYIGAINLNRPFVPHAGSTAPQQEFPLDSTCICHQSDLLAAYGRCPYCSWGARMPNADLNTHFDILDPKNKYPPPGPNPPPGWPKEIEWKPFAMVPRKAEPEGFQPFDPRCMLWYSQWEIVFAKTYALLDDISICNLFRYRWADRDLSTRFMQPHHVGEILALLHYGHEWHKHAFWFQGKERFENSIRAVRAARDTEDKAKEEALAAKWKTPIGAATQEWETRMGALTEKTKALEANTLQAEEKMEKCRKHYEDMRDLLALTYAEFIEDSFTANYLVEIGEPLRKVSPTKGPV